MRPRALRLWSVTERDHRLLKDFRRSYRPLTREGPHNEFRYFKKERMRFEALNVPTPDFTGEARGQPTIEGRLMAATKAKARFQHAE
jgi:hypothetical protein